MAIRIEPNLFFNSLFSNKETFHVASISDPYMLPPMKHLASQDLNTKIKQSCSSLSFFFQVLVLPEVALMVYSEE